MKEQKFEVGDKVRAWGVDGVVEIIDAAGNSKVNFVNGASYWFIKNGKFAAWHEEPSLFIVEKAKKGEPVIQWYRVLTMLKGSNRPSPFYGPFKSEGDFLDVVGHAKDSFKWIKLIPVYKTQGDKLVEE